MPRRAIFILGAFLAGLTFARAQDCAGPMPDRCSLLNQAKAIFVGELIEENKESFTRKFRVIEAFKGVKSDFIDVAEYRGPLRYKLAGAYLVFANACPWESPDTDCLTSWACSNTRELKYAAALVEQLRAEKTGKRLASVYGTLMRTAQEREDDTRPLINTLIRLRSGHRSFETKTDVHGVYAFNRLPPGTWQVSADLPPNLELAELIGPDAARPFELPRRSCFEHDFYALPTGRISGRVIGPDGTPLRTDVDLYRAGQYSEGARGMLNLHGHLDPAPDGHSFEFYRLAGGDYVLVFNPENEQQPDNPFPRTFYPDAATLENSHPIHISDGQEISNADIRVSNPLLTRQITVRLDWNGMLPEAFVPPRITAKSSLGTQPYPRENGRDTYTLNLLLTARYTIQALARCRLGTKGKTETAEVTIDGNDMSISEVTLTFQSGGCIPK